MNLVTEGSPREMARRSRPLSDRGLCLHADIKLLRIMAKSRPFDRCATVPLMKACRRVGGPQTVRRIRRNGRCRSQRSPDHVRDHATACASASGPHKAAMKIATWNINGVKARLEGAVTWLKEASPDVACFQEIKSVTEALPGRRPSRSSATTSPCTGRRASTASPSCPSARSTRSPCAACPATTATRMPATSRCGAARRRRGARRQSLSAQRQSDRHRQVRLQARLDAALRGAHARAAGAGGAVPAARRLQRHPRAGRRQEPASLDRGCAVPARDARRLPRARQSGPDRRRARLPCRGPASTPSGTTRPAPGRRTTASASTTSWPRRRPPIGWSSAGIDKLTRGWEKPSDHVPVWVELRE